MDILSKIQSVIESSIKDKEGNKRFVDFTTEDQKEIVAIEKLFKMDFNGYVHCIDRSGIIHSLKHKNILSSDILLIPYIIENYDSISLGNEENTIVYKKQIGEVYFLVEGVRTGRKKLALKTFYKKTKKRTL